MTMHAYKPGDVVEVYNQTLGGREFVEGEATIVETTEVSHQYVVRFHSEPDETYERFVPPPTD